MEKQYRIKIKERIVGPVTSGQIVELYLKGHIKGNEDCQEFPAGNWQTLSNFKDLINDIGRGIKNKTDIESEKMRPFHDDSEIREFAYNSEDKIILEDPVEVEDKFQEFKKDRRASDKSSSLNDESEKNISIEESHEISEKNSDIEKTRVISTGNLKNKTVSTTVVITRDELKEMETEEIEEEKEEIEEKVVVNIEEKTQFLNIGTELDILHSESDEFEKEIKNAIALRENDDVAVVEVDDEDSEDVRENKKKKKTKKKIRPIIAIVFVALIYYLLMDEEKVIVFKPIYTSFNFPMPFEMQDDKMANKLYRQGNVEYKKGTYLTKIKAAKLYSQSLSHKFRDNVAIEKLILTYAELFPSVKDKLKASRVLFQLIQYSRATIYKSADAATGTALFYSNMKLYESSVDTIENYLRMKSRPSVKLFSVYLDVMLRSDNFENLKKIYDILDKVKNKSPEAYISLANYHKFNQDFDKAADLIGIGVRKHKKSVPLLLKYADVLLENQNYSKLKKVLGLVEGLKSEYNPTYYSKYLESLGMVSALKGRVELATSFFKSALKYSESTELRNKLSVLKLEGSNASIHLIAESKCIKLINDSKRLFASGRKDMSLLKAIEAFDLLPNYVPAGLHLAKLQLERGYFERSLKLLNEIHEKYIMNHEVTYQLVLTQLRSYRPYEAKQTLLKMVSSDFGLTFYYASALGRYYVYEKNFQLAKKWISKSLSLNPMFSKDYYVLAKMFVRYKKFKFARKKIDEAINLEPQNLDFKILYATIFYEIDGANAAIGYLRELLKKFPNNPRIIGEITKLYSRSGQVKYYERYRKRLENLMEKDEFFYRYLLNMSELESDYPKMAETLIKLVKIKPGDIGFLLKLGEAYLFLEKYDKASKVFKSIKERLPYFPKVNFFLGEISMYKNEYEDAFNYGVVELKENPRSEFGYFLKGKSLYYLKKYSQSVKALEKSISLNGEFLDALKFLAKIKKRQNYLAQSRELYIRAKNQDKNDPEIYKELAEIYENTGQRALALEHYKLYLEIDITAPDRNKIKRKMKELE